jgi:hypothetical protein
MVTAVEHMYVSCTCTNGMRSGERCADCNGRGVVPKGTKPSGESIPADAGASVGDDDPYLNLGMQELRDKARTLGVGAGGGRAALVERIREAEANAEPTADAAEATAELSDGGQAVQSDGTKESA